MSKSSIGACITFADGTCDVRARLVDDGGSRGALSGCLLYEGKKMKIEDTMRYSSCGAKEMYVNSLNRPLCAHAPLTRRPGSNFLLRHPRPLLVFHVESFTTATSICNIVQTTLITILPMSLSTQRCSPQRALAQDDNIGRHRSHRTIHDCEW